MNSLRYARQVALSEIGEAGQQKLRNGSALLVGIGGLGAPAVGYLAGAGIGHLVLNDFDRVDETNLHRQTIFRTKDMGRRKVTAAADAVSALNPACKVTTYDKRLSENELENIVSGVSVVLDGSDNFTTRFTLNRVCHAAGKPLVSGAAIRFSGQFAVFRHDLDGSPCYRCLYDEDSETIGDCAGHGVFGPVTGVIGSLMAGEALKLIAGAGDVPGNRLTIFDGATGELRQTRFGRDPACPVCG